VERKEEVCPAVSAAEEKVCVSRKMFCLILPCVLVFCVYKERESHETFVLQEECVSS